jgi:hypothetical protein
MKSLHSIRNGLVCALPLFYRLVVAEILPYVVCSLTARCRVNNGSFHQLVELHETKRVELGRLDVGIKNCGGNWSLNL